MASSSSYPYSEARREQLRGQIEVPDVNNTILLVRYIATAKQLQLQASEYWKQGDLNNAYVYFQRMLRLCLYVIPKHNAYAQPKYAKDIAWIKAVAPKTGEALTQVVQQMEEEEKFLLEERRKEIHREEKGTRGRKLVRMNSEDLEAELFSPSHSFKNLNIGTTQISEGPSTLTLHPPEATPPLLPLPSPESQGKQNAGSSLSPTSADVKEALSVLFPVSSRSNYPQSIASRPAPPVSYPQLSSAYRPPAVEQERPTPLPRGNLHRMPSSLLSINHLERSITFPSDLISRFLVLAEPNTKKQPYGIETCGILAGIVSHNDLVVTTLVIPKQTGTSDSCTMESEEELLEFCSMHSLLVLGWVHTHPRQSCFMSSLDMHTQCGFQAMMPEALAIVLAPEDKEQQVGIFRLTPSGLKVIQLCRLSGFHPHSESNLYGTAQGVQQVQRAIKLVDLR